MTDKFGAYSRHEGPGCNIGETKYREKEADAHRKQTTMNNFQGQKLWISHAI